MGVQYILETFNDKVKEGRLSRIIFTEIGHNYINPTASKFEYEINIAFGKLDKWSQQTVYKNLVQIFNEYTLWAVFILYAHDNFISQDFEIINHDIVNLMINRKKFFLFKP